MADGAAPLSAAGRRDRLSALSDDLLHQIITHHLPVTEAAKTAALARRWRHLWSSTPLVLRDAAVPEPARDALVPRVLPKHPGHFSAVALLDCRLASLDRELPGWPRLLADKHTQKLYLANRSTPNLTVEIGSAANLRVLGHLDTRVHRLQIRDTAIGLNTVASTSTAIPSVKILAVTVNFGVLWEVKMLACFLRCFPNIDTLHIESALHGPSVTANEPSGEHHARFWQEATPVECLRSDVKKMVIHEFRGDQNEFQFLKFVAMNAQELQSLHVVLQEENTSSTDKVNETREKLQSLQFQTGISGVLLVLPTEGSLSRLQKATDLTFDDPFRF